MCVPGCERAPHAQVVRPKDLYVDVVVRARLTTEEQVERPAAGEPPPRTHWREGVGQLARGQRIPVTEIRRCHDGDATDVSSEGRSCDASRRRRARTDGYP